MEDISRQPSTQDVAGLLLAAFTKVYSEDQEQKVHLKVFHFTRKGESAKLEQQRKY